MNDQLPMLAASTVVICLLLAASKLVLAARRISTGAALAFATGFGAFALAAALPLLTAGHREFLAAAALPISALAAVGVAALWSGFWLRAGRRWQWWLPCTAVLLWMLPPLAGRLTPVPAFLQATAVAIVICAAAAGSIWCLYFKPRERNAADYALILWLLLFLPLPPLAVYLDPATATAGILWARAPLAVPTLLLGIGLFTLLAFTLDAIADSSDLAYTDALTGLHNRRAFDAELTLAVARAERYQRDLSLLVVDIDEFKRLNDTHGHPAGDAVIRLVARALVENARRIDIVARIGGEEFGLILADTPSSAALRLAERMRQAIGRAGHEYISVSASFGVASMDATIRTPQRLLQAADGALYGAKQAGRNRVRFAGDPDQEIEALIAPAGA